MKKGQVLNLKIGYADGGAANYKRPFLIIDIKGNCIYSLNISSLKNKTHKILYDSTLVINRYKPPLRVLSYLKLDALYKIPIVDGIEKHLMDKGNQLNKKEFDYIHQYFFEFKESNMVYQKEVSVEELALYNEYINIDDDMESKGIIEESVVV
ncbi:hypothetical protein [Clostridium paraputrificum]|uniref:hypothetical protein n=1 Tax=Clostridium paraputrificum TaxID=29363 RepID=UPI00247FD2FC|nr:hypothetical protein [Clostridium paraputrificum]MDB2085834.1 hypothetical protein [Clostridium paraputrificum]